MTPQENAELEQSIQRVKDSFDLLRKELAPEFVKLRDAWTLFIDQLAEALKPAAAALKCPHPEDNELWQCHDGALYGPCGSPYCSGACEYEGSCTCNVNGCKRCN